MKLSVLALFVALFCLGAATPSQAHPRDGILFGLGFGLGVPFGFYPGYYYGYPSYGYSTYSSPTYYYYPPAASYAPPEQETYASYPPPQQESYASYPPPQQETYAPSPFPQAPMQQFQQPPAEGPQPGTCRRFQSTIDGAPVTGTACLQPDGTWRTVAE